MAKKVSKNSDEFSSSKGYSVGELCIHDNKVYRCKTAYSTGASWASRSTYFEEVSLVDAVSDLNSELMPKQIFLNNDTNIVLVRCGNMRCLFIYNTDTTGAVVPVGDRPLTNIASVCVCRSNNAIKNLIVTIDGTILAGMPGETPSAQAMRGQIFWFV